MIEIFVTDRLQNMFKIGEYVVLEVQIFNRTIANFQPIESTYNITTT